jgi:alpha-N-arabinofuranosidase
VDVALYGVETIHPTGYCATLNGDPHDTNSLAEPTKIVPTKSEFEAGSSFAYTFPAYSITVLRVNATKPPKRP